jgi:maleate isomerase
MTRIGLIIPSSNRMVEEEMARWYPQDTQPHITRLRMTGAHRGPLSELLPRVREAAGALDDAQCAVVAFHCTANSTDDGLEGEQQILGTLRAAAKGKVTTTATAIRNALEALGARRIVLITPYTPQMTAHESEFFEAAGYEVIAQIPRDLQGSDGYCGAPPSFWYETALGAARADADVYFLSCANIRCIGIIDELEKKLDRPVITSNQAVMWESLRGLTAQPGPGRLFSAS